MNILVTGANGQLGNEMRILASGHAEHTSRHPELVSGSDRYIFTDVNQVEGVETTYLDITDLEAVRAMVAEYKVDAIVNCAAWTNVDGAEDPEKYELVEKLNATAPENLAKAMKEVGGLLVHISTDYVFGAEPYNTPCKEDQTGTPTGVYGLTKLHGEQNIIRVFEDDSSPFKGDRRGSYVIIRTAWLYSEFGKNFVKTMLNLTATKPQLKVVFDQVGTPTYALDLAKAIVTILNDWKSECLNQSSPFKGGREEQNLPPLRGTERVSYSKNGIYHYSNEGVCSWYDFTKMIQQIATELEAKKSPFKGDIEGPLSAHSNPESPFKGDLEGSLSAHSNPKSPFKGDLEGLCDIQPCHSSEFPSPVTRPSYSVLDKTKIKQTFGITVPYWTDSLKTCLKNLK